MDADKLNQYAEVLALCAVSGERAGLEKIAAEYQKQAVIDMETLKGYMANPYVRNSLIGLGAGGLIGALQPRRKLRNALTYGLIGGLGGLGSAALFNQMGGQQAASGAPPAAGDGNTPPASPGTQPKLSLEEAKKNLDAAADNVQKEQANPYLYAGGGAAGGGVAGYGAGRMMGESAGEIASRALGHLRGRRDEIGALTNAANLPRSDQAAAQGIQQLQDRFRRAPGNAGNVAAFADDLATSADPRVQAAVQRNLGAATPTQTQQAAQQLARNVEQIVNRGRLPVFGRAQAARQLSQAQDLIEAQRLAANPPRRGGGVPTTATALGERQILDALNNVRTRTPVMPRFLPRAGGVLGGLGLGAAGAYGGYRAGGGYANYINNPLYRAYDQADAAYRAAGGK